MNITLRDVPPELHRRLKESAKANGRSLNKEAINALDKQIAPPAYRNQAFLDKLDADRKRTNVFVKQKDLEKIIQEGRR